MHHSRLLGFVGAWILALGAGGASAAGPESYIRVQDSAEGDRIEVQTAITTFRPSSGEGPEIHLVGVIHIGDHSYYEELQKFLDAQALVLYEGVKPAPDGVRGQDDETCIKVTKSRQRLLAVMLARHRKEHGAYPEALEDAIKDVSGTLGRLARAAVRDGWGREQVYSLEANDKGGKRVEILSLGADGAPGGAGASADLRLSEQPAITKREVASAGQGLQIKLASALGLEFQLASIDYGRPTWRNSDMSIDEVQARLEARGVSAAGLLGMLDGRSMSARIVSFMLGFIESDPRLRFMVKVMLAEAMANADAMMEAGGAAGAGAMMQVIVIDRNDAVMSDLRRTLEDGAKVPSIAMFYGAGHLPDMAQKLVADFGYEPGETRWMTGISIDLNEVPHGAAQARQMREQVRRMMESQRKALDKGDGDAPGDE